MDNILTESLLIFGGSYSNLHATQALKAWADEHGFAADQIICTGDIIAYCAHPQETVDFIRNWLGDCNAAGQGRCIQGNVEQSLATQADDCGCGFEAGTTCDVLAKGWYDFAQSAINAQTREWFSLLPETISFTLAGKNVKIIHGAPSAVSRFMFASMDEVEFEKEFEQTNADIIIAGHSGMPFTKQLSNGKVWHNSGALGMPANDGTSRVWFSVCNISNEGEIQFQHHALTYDAEAASRQMQDRGLTQAYDQTLLNGLWPSMDVLPEEETHNCGVALEM